MKRKQIYLGLILAMLGLIGMATILTMNIPLPAEVEELLKESYTPEQIKLLILINPSILLFVAVVVGTILYQRVHLRVPIVEKWIGINKEPINVAEIIKSGVIGGIIAGIGMVLVVILFKPMMLAEYEKLSQSVQLTLANRFLYGGITEEIYVRFGLMTLIVWISSKVFKGTKPTAYWIGIVLAALLFAIGHFPIVFNTIEKPSMILLSYVLIGNTIGGLIFGWLYWKKGLESAFIAHMFIHVVLVIAEKTVI
jgi:membrane protease YdiL (CAAX protease family)